jgi:glycosyltransferase involved in cell wall biosynthesis
MNDISVSKKITVLVPCYNEEKGVGAVIDAFLALDVKPLGYELDVVVIDNNSKDRTSEVAAAHGARVIFEEKKGKGNAIRKGFYSISDDTDYVVMLDGDNTYRPEEMLRLVELLDSGFATVVLGSRLFGKMSEGSMKRFNHFGNCLYSYLVRHLYGISVTDVLTGYYAWNRAAILNLRPHLQSDGFTIEMEMITKMAILGEDIYSVPVGYDARAGESNLSPIADGYAILVMLVRNLFWKPCPETSLLAQLQQQKEATT